MHRPIIRTALAVALANAVNAHAVEDEAAVIVTATRQFQKSNDLIADVTVIDRQQIDESAAATLGELLGRQTGIEFNRPGGPGTTENIYIRGSNSDHVLVLIDGMRVGSATLGVTSLEMVPLSQIERIEVLRGPGSALYGADALGGIIQIFTRNAHQPTTQFVAGYGNRGTYEASASHQSIAGAWKYGFSAGASGSAGANQISNSNSAYFNPDKDGFRNHNASANAAYDFGSGEVGMRHLSSESTNRYDSATLDASWNYIMASSNWSMRHRVSSTGAWMKNNLNRYWASTLTVSRGIDDTRSTPSATLGRDADSFKTRSDQIGWQNDFRLPVGHALIALERLKQEVISTTDYPTRSRTISSLLAGWNGNIGRHSVQANFRLDRNSQFGNKGTQTLGYAYRLNDVLKVSAMGGTAFKAPTFNQIYFPATPGVGIGNPNLKPESARNLELRLAYNAASMDASVTWFQNKISNLINWGDAPAPYFLTPTNIGSATISGWEGSMETRHAGWSAGGNIALQNPVNEATQRQLNRRAKRHGVVYLSRQVDAWKIRVEATGASSTFDDAGNTRRIGGHGLVNVYAEKLLGPSVTLFGRAENVFDRKYVVARSSATLDNSIYLGTGASLFAGLRYDLK